MNLKAFVKLLLGAMMMFCFTNGHAQLNLSGKPGLLNIPTARETQDGELHVGYFYNPVEYAAKYNGRFIYPESVYSINVTILPRLDLNLSLLNPIYKGSYRIEGIGDRQIEFKYQVLKETEKLPALALYLSAPFGRDVSIATNVLVATKNFKLNEQLSLEASAGYASPWYVYRRMENAKDSASVFAGFKIGNKNDGVNPHLAGPIAGAKLSYKNQVGVMAEWDSQRINTGVYATFFKCWTVQAGLIGLNAFTAGTSFRAQLKKKKKV